MPPRLIGALLVVGALLVAIAAVTLHGTARTVVGLIGFTCEIVVYIQVFRGRA